ncbi:hypothetical protein Dimus_014759 [Dionaea muscipula]
MVSQEIAQVCDSEGVGQCSLKSQLHHSDAVKGAAESQETANEVQGSIFNEKDLESGKKENHDGDSSIIIQEESVIDRQPPQTIDSADQEDNISKGVKRPRTDSEEPSVRILYSSLRRKSKRKLEELLHQWSEWHAYNCCSDEDLQEELEYGEETYFPAVLVGPDKSPIVSFVMDDSGRKRQQIDNVKFGSDGTPLYEREYGIALTGDGGSIKNEICSDLREAARCFNCGSYNHSLKDCPKPRDAAAVTNARKQFHSKKSLSNGPRILTRYYQNSAGCKYDGLKPGVLSPETRKLLGLEELDPPPWLNRMRELGYPPGYLDSEEEDQPSGIMIFGDEIIEDAVGRGNGKSEDPKCCKKMSVDFPGLNAPVPENADKKWVTCQDSSNSNFLHKPCDKGQNDYPMATANVHHHDQRHLRSFGASPSNHYPGSIHLAPYYVHNFPTSTTHHPIESCSPRGIPILRNPEYWTPASDRGSPFSPGESTVNRHYTSLPQPSPYLYHSPLDYGTSNSRTSL